jgi:hypothetical protein
MSKFFAEPVVRLFLRSLLIAVTVFLSKFVIIDPTGQHITYSTASLGAAVTAAVYAFASVFTPLNSLVGVFKGDTATPAATK